MFAIGYEELKKLKWADKSTACCPKCGKNHKIIWSKEKLIDGTTVETKSLGAVRCKGKSYLVSVKGKLL